MVINCEVIHYAYAFLFCLNSLKQQELIKVYKTFGFESTLELF